MITGNSTGSALSRSAWLQTPDYKVPYAKNDSKSLRSPSTFYTEEQLMKTHAKFVKFKKKLHKLGFLSDDLHTMDDFTFVTENTNPTRIINYTLSSYNRYSKNKLSREHEALGYAPESVSVYKSISLFSVHTQKGHVLSLSRSGSELNKKAFEDSGINPLKNFYVKPSHVLRNEYTYSETLDYLTSLRKLVIEQIESYGYVTTPQKIIKAIALDRLMGRGLGVTKGTHKDVVDDYVYQLVDSEASLTACFYALSKEMTPDFMETGKFTLTIDAVLELNEIPDALLIDMMG
jgi:hypothetical protein